MCLHRRSNPGRLRLRWALYLKSYQYNIYQCCGSGMFILNPRSRILDPTFFHPGSRIRPVSIPDPGSRIRIKEFKHFKPPKNQKKWFLISRKYDPSCSSRILDPNADFLPIPDPGSWIQGSKRHWIPDPCQPPPTPWIPPHTRQMQGDLPTPLTHNNTQQHYTTALGYIKLSMYLLFLWRVS